MGRPSRRRAAAPAAPAFTRRTRRRRDRCRTRSGCTTPPTCIRRHCVQHVDPARSPDGRTSRSDPRITKASAYVWRTQDSASARTRTVTASTSPRRADARDAEPPHRAGSKPSGRGQPGGAGAALGRIQSGVDALGPTDGSPRTRITIGIARDKPSIHKPRHCNQTATRARPRAKPAQLFQVDRTPDDDQQISSTRLCTSSACTRSATRADSACGMTASRGARGRRRCRLRHRAG